MAVVNIAQELRVILEQAEDQIVTLSEETMRAIAKETAERIRLEAQIKKGLHETGKYARGWTVKQRKKRGKITSFVVYNRSKPGLTMLLEKGHLIRNKSGSYGRTLGIPHIAPAEKWAQGEIMRRLGHRLGQMR